MADERRFDVRAGRLLVDDIDVVDLAARNHTPFFLFSAREIASNIAALRAAFLGRHAATEFFFASKACSNLWFLNQVRRAGVNVEVNAGGELIKALRAGFTPDQIVFNGVAKTEAEIATAVQQGVRSIVIDSIYEIGRVAGVAGALHLTANVALRIDVDVPTQTHPGLKTTHGGKAGIDIDDTVAAFRLAAAHEELRVTGMHLHIGSQITSVEPYGRAIETALDLVELVESQAGVRLEHLNAGGGFAIPYRELPAVCRPTDYFCSTLTPDDYAEVICSIIERRRPGLRLFLEPGRSIAGSAAVLVSRVENEKVKGVRDASGSRASDEHWLTVDAGFNTLLEHTNYRWYFRAVVAGRAGEPADGRFRLAGPLCDGGDVFMGDDDTDLRNFPAATSVGDVIVFLDAGAYTLEMMSQYNARPRAAAYAVDEGKVVQIRTADTLDDMTAHDLDEAGQPLGSGATAADFV
jgi:diaminopimelate decarboxylase